MESQRDQLIKLIQATTENHKFEEREVVNRIGSFFKKIEDVFGMKWQDLREEQFSLLINLHEKLPEFEEPLL